MGGAVVVASGFRYSKLRFQDRVDKVRLLSEGVATGLEGRGLGGS